MKISYSHSHLIVILSLLLLTRNNRTMSWKNTSHIKWSGSSLGVGWSGDVMELGRDCCHCHATQPSLSPWPRCRNLKRSRRTSRASPLSDRRWMQISRRPDSWICWSPSFPSPAVDALFLVFVMLGWWDSVAASTAPFPFLLVRDCRAYRLVLDLLGLFWAFIGDHITTLILWSTRSLLTNAGRFLACWGYFLAKINSRVTTTTSLDRWGYA